MAWRELSAKAPEAAARWFEKALAWSPPGTPDPGLVEGYVAALQAQKKFDEADKLAARWRGVSPRFDLIYLQSEVQALRAADGGAPTASAKYAGIAAEVEKAHSGEGALSLGWLAYETKDYARALTWFHNAVAWGGDGDKGKEGVALSLRALDRFEELAAFGYAERGSARRPRSLLRRHDRLVDRRQAGARSQAGGAARSSRRSSAKIAAPMARRRSAGASIAARPRRGRAALVRKRRRLERLRSARRSAESRTPSGSNWLRAMCRLCAAAGDLSRSEDVAYVWRDASPGIAGLYLQIVTQEIADDTAILTSQRLARFAGFAQDEALGRSGGGARVALLPRQGGGGRDRLVRARARLVAGRRAAEEDRRRLCVVAARRRPARRRRKLRFRSRQRPDMRALYISAVVAELADAKAEFGGARLSRFVATVGAARSSAGAQALGWRRLKQDNCVYAAPWFRKAQAWSADSAEDGDTARGLALSLRKVGAYAEAEDDRLRLARSQPRDGQIVRRHRRRGADARGAGRSTISEARRAPALRARARRAPCQRRPCARLAALSAGRLRLWRRLVPPRARPGATATSATSRPTRVWR